jgi:hypothetical protein
MCRALIFWEGSPKTFRQTPSKKRARRKHVRGRNAGGGKPLCVKPVAHARPAEKCQALAQIALHSITTYLNDDGSFDLLRSRRRLPEGCLKKFVVKESAKVDRRGAEITRRIINVVFHDRIAALRLHDSLFNPVVSSRLRRRQSKHQAMDP